VKIQVEVFLVVRPCRSVAVGYHHFGGSHPEDGGSKVL